MSEEINVGGIPVDVVFKDIKNVHLSVHPPTGRIRIAAPERTSLDTLRIYAISKLDWIKRQQRKLQEQERETVREYLDRESHYVWGKRYLLQIKEEHRAPNVELKHTQMVLTIRHGSGADKREAVVSGWYRKQLRKAVLPIIERWEPLIGVNVNHIYIQKMKTKWGGCNPGRGNIRLNSELAKKPLKCLEYVAVHELVHLLEPTHNKVFVSYMDQFMPNWRHYRDELNRSPLAHQDWKY